MIFNLLTSASTSSSSNASGGGWQTWIFPLLLLGLLVVYFVFGTRSQKKKQKEVTDMRNSIQAGSKVTTIGGIVGIVVEVNDEENSFVLVTGSDKSGKSFMKFDKQAIYTVSNPKKEEAKEEAKEEPQVEETQEAQTEEKTEE